MSPGQVRISRRDGVVVATLSGEFDISNAAELGDDLTGALEDDSAGVVIDLTGVRYIDSAGVRLFFAVARTLDESRHGIALVLQSESPVRTLVKITNLDEVAPVYASVDEAVAGLRERSEDLI